MDMTPRAVKTQGVVLVVIDLSKEVSSSAVTWALENAVRNGDLLRLVGIITHVQNPSKSTNLTNLHVSQSQSQISASESSELECCRL